MSSECEKSGHFYICHPDHVSKSSIKETGILRSKSHHSPPASVHQSTPRRSHPIMADCRSSSSLSRSTKTGEWEKCSVPHSRLVELQTKGFLPPAYIVPVRAGLATYNGREQAESSPNPSKGERVCLVPYLLRGLKFPIHLFLRGLLEFYGLQLHNFTLPPYCILQAK